MNLDGAVIDSSVIGGTTAAAGTFTTLTASGDLTVDTNTLKVDSTNNRVGINNASPSAELDITGTGEDISVRINAPTGYDAELKFANNGSTAFTLGHDDATDNFVIGTANVDTNQRFVIDSSGKTGIGTATANKLFNLADPDQGGEALKLHFEAASGSDKWGIYAYDRTNSHYANMSLGQNAIWINGSDSNVGIGTTSPSRQLHLVNSGNALMKLESTSASGYGGIDFANASRLWFAGVRDDLGDGFGIKDETASAIRLAIDTSGRVGIGTSSPDNPLHVYHATTNGVAHFESGDSGVNISFSDSATTAVNYNTIGASGNSLIFASNGTERARITDGGALLVGTTSTTIGTSNFGAVIFADGRPKFSKNVDGGSHVMNVYGNAGEFRVYGDGDVLNTNNSYGAISDQKLKENIDDATDKLNEINQVRIRNFNFIGDDLKQIGVIAQELETIFPSMVKTIPDTDSDGNDLGTETKSVKYSVFVPILIKALQEADDKIDALEARITALES